MCIFLRANAVVDWSWPPLPASASALSCRPGLHDHFISRAPSRKPLFCARRRDSCTCLTPLSFPLQ